MIIDYKKQLSNSCWAVKAIAMIFVIVAHTDFSIIRSSVGLMILSRLGAIAVPVYLILAGYFFNASTISSFWAFLRKKVVALCLPWLSCGLLVYGYTAWRSGVGLSVSDVVSFVLGKDSYLYYLTVLLVLQVLFYYLREVSKKVLFWICLCLTAISLLLTVGGALHPVMKCISITPYLNPFNWCGFFALGYVAQDWDAEKLIAALRKLWIPTVIVWLLLGTVGSFFERNFGYFSWLGLPMELCSSILLLRLGIALSDSCLLRTLGKYSFAVYLLHIQAVPVVAKFLGGYVVGVLLSPIISYAVTIGAVWCICRIAQWLRFGGVMQRLLGVR